MIYTLPPVVVTGQMWIQVNFYLNLLERLLICFVSYRFFSGYSGFPLSLKTNTFKFQFDLERTDTFQRVLKNSLVIRG